MRVALERLACKGSLAHADTYHMRIRHLPHLYSSVSIFAPWGPTDSPIQWTVWQGARREQKRGPDVGPRGPDWTSVS